MAYTRSKRTRIKRTRGRRTRRTRSYKKGGQFSTPPRGANGVRSSVAYGQPQQQYGQPQQQQQQYSPQGQNNLMGAFNSAATPGPLTGRYNNSGQYSPSSIAYPGYN
jgi:hypothetical protein